MSLLLAIGALYVTGKVLAEAGRDVKKIPARKQINEDSKKGNFDVVKNFEEILYVCDVKRKKHNSSVKVLPYTGYEQCMEYIRSHSLTSKADEKRFIRHYKKVLSKEISKRQSEWDKKYFEMEKQVKAMMKTDEFEIVRYTYFDVFMNRGEVETKVNDLCANKTGTAGNQYLFHPPFLLFLLMSFRHHASHLFFFWADLIFNTLYPITQTRTHPTPITAYRSAVCLYSRSPLRQSPMVTTASTATPRSS